MRTSLIFLLALVAACSGKDDKGGTQDDTGGDTAGANTDPANTDDDGPYVLHGAFGSLSIVEQQRGVTSSRSYRTQGLFSDSATVGAIATAAWCRTGGPCIPGLPPNRNDFLDSVPFPEDTADVYWAWVGNTIGLGQLQVPFIHDVVTGLGHYDLDAPRNPDGTPVLVTFGGEMGDFREDVDIPAPIELLTPDPRNPVPMAGVIPFTWTPADDGEVILRVQGGGVDRVYRLADDGAFNLDLQTLTFTDNTTVNLYIGRWNLQTLDMSGNTVTVLAANEQPLLGDECRDYPDVTIINEDPPAKPYIRPTHVGLGFDAVIDSNKIRDFRHDSDGDGTTEDHSATLTFTVFEDAGAGQQALCQVVYDASPDFSALGDGPTGSNGQTIYEAFFLRGEKGETNCTAVDPALYGTDDVRGVIESRTWGFGIGDVVALEDQLAQAFSDWPAIQQQIAGAYVTNDGLNWIEAGYVWTFEMESCGTVDPDNQKLDKPVASPIPVARYTGVPMVLFELLVEDEG